MLAVCVSSSCSVLKSKNCNFLSIVNSLDVISSCPKSQGQEVIIKTRKRFVRLMRENKMRAEKVTSFVNDDCSVPLQ